MCLDHEAVMNLKKRYLLQTKLLILVSPYLRKIYYSRKQNGRPHLREGNEGMGNAYIFVSNVFLVTNHQNNLFQEKRHRKKRNSLRSWFMNTYGRRLKGLIYF